MEIKSYFSNIKTANETVEQLKAAGFTNAYIDANDHYIDDRDTQTDLPGTEGTTNLSDLVLKSGSGSQEASPLGAANPMVSGMGGFEEITDFNCSVTVETNEANIQKAKDIIENMGGELEDPNINKPRRISQADVDLEKAIRNLNEKDNP